MFEYEKTHDLLKLYDNLMESIRNLIESKAAQKKITSVREVLVHCKNDFVKLRYKYFETLVEIFGIGETDISPKYRKDLHTVLQILIEVYHSQEYEDICTFGNFEAYE